LGLSGNGGRDIDGQMEAKDFSVAVAVIDIDLDLVYDSRFQPGVMANGSDFVMEDRKQLQGMRDDPSVVEDC
jgi:hypothetical protein